jgi:putative transposase
VISIRHGISRIIAPGCPHRVTARGNRREPVFFEDGDQEIHVDILGEQLLEAKVEAWCYCLMPNHVRLILTPQDAALCASPAPGCGPNALAAAC